VADIFWSIDGGVTWHKTEGGDPWPQKTGEYQVRRRVRRNPLKPRIRVRITSTDNDDYGIRSITVKGNAEPQEESLR
jgi:hypothetical protein